jgi:hypothetical protein
MHARYYSSVLGKFLSIDRIPESVHVPQAWNRYEYAVDNPLKYTDPSGLWIDFAYDYEMVLHSIMPSVSGTIDVYPEAVIYHGWLGGPRDDNLGARLVYGYFAFGHRLLDPIAAKLRSWQQTSDEITGEHIEWLGLAAIFFFDNPVLDDPEITVIAGVERSEIEATIERIESGRTLPEFRHDGVVFKNREGLLPQQPSGCYHEYVHATAGVSGPGARRVVAGAGGEYYFTTDHYETLFVYDEQSAFLF